MAPIDVGMEHDIYDYSGLGLYCLGKTGELFVDFSIALYSTGALMSYIVVVGTLETELTTRWGWMDQNYELYIVIDLFALPNCC